MSIRDKVAVVTGGAKGIGRAISHRLCQDGAKVIILDADLEGAKQAAGALAKIGECAALRCDLSKPEEVKGAARECLDSFGQIDILCNNAASLGDLRPLLEDSYQNWNAVLHTNLIGPFLLTQAAVADMRSRGKGGRIVNITAIQAASPLPNFAPYAASKGGLTSFTKSLAVELDGTGILANAIEVGCVFTEGMFETRPERYRDLDEAEFRQLLDRKSATLSGRYGQPEDIAAVVSFLVSEENRHVVGEILRADGGRRLSRKPDPLL
jgi:NAD(P)-dependent dehydrogenase (short-subunit alcohol dehydrogenase family)